MAGVRTLSGFGCDRPIARTRPGAHAELAVFGGAVDRPDLAVAVDTHRYLRAEHAAAVATRAVAQHGSSDHCIDSPNSGRAGRTGLERTFRQGRAANWRRADMARVQRKGRHERQL